MREMVRGVVGLTVCHASRPKIACISSRLRASMMRWLRGRVFGCLSSSSVSSLLISSSVLL